LAAVSGRPPRPSDRQQSLHCSHPQTSEMCAALAAARSAPARTAARPALLSAWL